MIGGYVSRNFDPLPHGHLVSRYLAQSNALVPAFARCIENGKARLSTPRQPWKFKPLGCGDCKDRQVVTLKKHAALETL
jgi:hypothetical protein